MFYPENVICSITHNKRIIIPVNITCHKYNIVRFLCGIERDGSSENFIVIISVRTHFTEACQNLIANCHCILSGR